MIKHILEVRCDCCNKVLNSNSIIILLSATFIQINKKKSLYDMELQQDKYMNLLYSDYEQKIDDFILCPHCVSPFLQSKDWFLK